jgi:hypothetical protein
MHYIPQSWGTSEAGGRPKTPGRKYPAPLFQQSLLVDSLASKVFEIRFLVASEVSNPCVHATNTPSLIYESAEIVSINPLIPQSWGTFEVGGHPQTPGRKYPAPLFQQSPLYERIR